MLDAPDTLDISSTEERLSLLRLHNARSAVGSVPTEVLSIIMEFAALSINEHAAINRSLLPSLLGSCALLRYCALDCAILWSYLRFRCDAGLFEITELEWLTIHLERSRRAGIRLQVVFEGKPELYSADDLKILRVASAKFRAFISPHAHRCVAIEVIEFEGSPFPKSRIPSFLPLDGLMP